MNVKDRNKKRWDSYVRNISNVFDPNFAITSPEDIIQHSKTLIKSYLLWTWPFLSKKYLEYASISIENSMVAASLLAVINSTQNEVTHKLLAYLSFVFNKGLVNNDGKTVRAVSLIFSSIYRFQIISFDIFLSLLLILLNKKNAYMNIVLEILNTCGPFMEEDNTIEFTQLFTEIVRLAGPRYDEQVQKLTRRRSQEWKDKSQRIPIKYSVLPSYENTISDLIIESFTEDPTENLINGYDFENFEKLYEKYTNIITTILGTENVKLDFDDEVEENENSSESEDISTNQEFIKLKSDKEFQKMIYLTITSTATASEAAHKLIKILVDEEKQIYKNLELKTKIKTHKRIVTETIIEYIGHSQVFDRNLGNIPRLLLANRKDLTESFEEYFRNLYSNNLDKYKTSQIINIAYLFAYLLQSDMITWNVLSIIKLSPEDTNTEQRMFIRYLMEKLSENRSWIMKKLKEPEVEASTSGIFLSDTLEHATIVSQFFEAINLEFLVEHVKAKINKMNLQPNIEIPSEDNDEIEFTKQSYTSESGSEKEALHRRSRHKHHHHHRHHH